MQLNLDMLFAAVLIGNKITGNNRCVHSCGLVMTRHTVRANRFSVANRILAETDISW